MSAVQLRYMVVPAVEDSIQVKKSANNRIVFEFIHFYKENSLGETQARTAVAQMYNIITAEPRVSWDILVKMAQQSEITTTLDSNRAYLDIIMHDQVKRIAIVFNEDMHSKSVAFVVNVFQKLTDKIRIFKNEKEALDWLST